MPGILHSGTDPCVHLSRQGSHVGSTYAAMVLMELAVTRETNITGPTQTARSSQDVCSKTGAVLGTGDESLPGKTLTESAGQEGPSVAVREQPW